MSDKKKAQEGVEVGQPSTLVIEQGDMRMVITLDLPPTDSDNQYAMFYRALFIKARDSRGLLFVRVPEVL